MYLCQRIIPWTRFGLEIFGGSDRPASCQPVLVMVAPRSKNRSPLCVWCLRHRQTGRYKLLLGLHRATPQKKKVRNSVTLVSNSLSGVSVVRVPSERQNHSRRCAGRGFSQVDLRAGTAGFQLDLKCCSQNPSLWTCSHTTGLRRGSSA